MIDPTLARGVNTDLYNHLLTSSSRILIQHSLTLKLIPSTYHYLTPTHQHTNTRYTMVRLAFVAFAATCASVAMSGPIVLAPSAEVSMAINPQHTPAADHIHPPTKRRTGKSYSPILMAIICISWLMKVSCKGEAIFPTRWS